MLLIHCTWPEVAEYLKRSQAIIIPIGSTEQHGPLGLIGTDAITAQAVAQGLGEQTSTLVAPTLSLGVAQFNLGFAGTVSVRASTLMAVIEDCVLSLFQQGFRQFYMVNGHGGNVAPARSAFQDLYAHWSLGHRAGDVPRCTIRSWWEYPQANALRQTWYGAAEGMHATPSEIAMTLHLLPGSQRTIATQPPVALNDQFLKDHGGDNHWDAQHHRDAFPDGRVGSDSALATAEQGRVLLAACVAGACADFQAFVNQA